MPEFTAQTIDFSCLLCHNDLVNFIDKRIYEAEKTGFSYCVIPKSNAKSIEGKFKIDIIEAENLTDIMKQICE